LRKPADLAGRRIAITQAGSSFHYSLGLLADKDHFTLAGMHLLPLQSLANIASALKGGSVDGALLPVTTALPLMAAGDIKLLGWVGDETPWQLGAVFVSRDMMRHRDMVAKFLAAYREGTRDYHDILLASLKDGRAQINDQTRPLIDSITRYTHLKSQQVIVGLSYIDRDGMLDVAGVAKQLAWFQKNHFVDPGFTITDVVEESFGYAK
jgi:NitT/TauT family transport system substrate-binding protein